MRHKDDGKYVVVKGAKRMSDLHPTEQAAIEESNRQRQLAESSGTQAQEEKLEVKQHLLG